MTREDPIVIVSAVRTPMGGFLGDFKDVNAATLGAAAVRAAVERARLQADEVDEAVLGCVLAAGQARRRRARRCLAPDWRAARRARR